MTRKEESSRPKTLLGLHHCIEKVSDAFYLLDKFLKIAYTMPMTMCVVHAKEALVLYAM